MTKQNRYVLMNPGSVNTSDRVKKALIQHDVCHRDLAFSQAMARVTEKLKIVFGATPDHSLLLITGSGTAATESALSSCVPTDKKVLIIDNGAFGARITEIAKLHKMPAVIIRYDFGNTVKVKDVQTALESDPEIAVVAMVHHETSVGILNPVHEIGKLCRQHECLFLVDAISSLGAEELNVVRDNIDVCWSTPNKCLHGVAGIAFVCVSPRVWPKIESIDARAYYLNLKGYHQYSEDLEQTPFTPAIANIFALDAACEEYLEDGISARQTMYAERNLKLRAGLNRIGISLFTDNGLESHSIVTARLPEGVSFDALYNGLRKHGFVVYDCKPPLQGKYFQVSNMGNLFDANLDILLDAIEGIISTTKKQAASM